MPDEVFERLQGDSSIDQLIHRITIAHKLPRHATHEDQRGEVRRSQPSVGKYEPRKGSPVVMGIIDEGIAFVNSALSERPMQLSSGVCLDPRWSSQR